jgi:hypothetical protein
VTLIGYPVTMLALVPPILAFVLIAVWAVTPARHRDPAFRAVLLVAVGLAALELILAPAGMIVVFILSGGFKNF